MSRADEIYRATCLDILENGFSVAAYNLPRGDMGVYERLISWGVTEFTEDHHVSMGLNW